MIISRFFPHHRLHISTDLGKEPSLVNSRLRVSLVPSQLHLLFSSMCGNDMLLAGIGIVSYERRMDEFAFYDDLGKNRMIGTPARPNKALMVKAMEIPSRSESQPTNTTTAAVLRNEIIIYNPLAAPRFLPQ